MVDILNIPELGKLEIVEIYEHYDQPVLYSCKNASGHFYLVVAAAEDDQFLTWLCVAVSTERLNLIRSGKIDLHDAFANSENPYAIQVRVPYAEHASVQTDFIQSNQIPEDMLPIPGECLDLETEILPVLSDAEEIVRLKKQEISSRLTISGILIAASLRTNSFEIKTAEKTYTGDIAGAFFETAENITLNLKYTAEIQEVPERSETTDELTKPKYLLLSLQPIVS